MDKNKELYQYLERNKQKDSKIRKFRKIATVQNFAQEINERDFYDQYYHFYYIAILLIVLTQIASAVSSYEYIAQIYTYKLPAPTIEPINGTLVLIVFSLLAIELVKNTLWRTSLRQSFARNPKHKVVLIIATAIISLFSAYASIKGGNILGKDKEKTEALKVNNQKEIEELKNIHNKRIEQKEARIIKIEQSPQYQRTVWTGRGQTKQELNATALQLIAELRNDINDIKQNNLSELSELKKRTQSEQSERTRTAQIQARNYSYAFAIAELLFICLNLFIYYFKQQAVLTFELTEPTEPTEPTELRQPVGKSEICHHAGNSEPQTVGFKLNPSKIEIKHIKMPKLQKSEQPEQPEKFGATEPTELRQPVGNSEPTEMPIQKLTVRPKSLQNVNAELSPNPSPNQEPENELMTKLLSHLDRKQQSRLKKYPRTVKAILEGKKWSDLLGEGWNDKKIRECGKTTYNELNNLIKEISIKN